MEILLTLPGFILAIIIVVIYEIKLRKPRNKVHFYVARDKNNMLFLFCNKPIRVIDFWSACERGYSICSEYYRFENLGLNINDYKDLKWEDEPIEVFLNMED